MWTLPPHSQILNTMAMMFNFFTMNGFAAPNTDMIEVKSGDSMRIRFANISMSQHPIHLHGHTWKKVATGSGRNPETSHTFSNTVLVPVGQTLDVEMDAADFPGTWIFHCHLPHHITNDMEVNPVPEEMMVHDAAGMFTAIVVRPADSPEGSNDMIHSPEDEMHGGHHPPESSEPGDSDEEEDPPHHGHMSMLKMGRYEGFITLENEKRLRASFELLKVQQDDQWRRLRGILKVTLGAPGSPEYVTQTFEKVYYDFKNKVLTFDDDSKNILISGARVSMSEGQTHLTGEISNSFNEIEGTLMLTHRSMDHPGHPHHNMPEAPHMGEDMTPVVMQLSGVYTSECKDRREILQLAALRGMNEEALMGSHPFEPYRIVGTLSANPSARGRDREEEDVFSVEATFKEGSYDYYTGLLILKGPRGSLQGVVTGNEIQIGDCTYTKQMRDHDGHRPGHGGKPFNIELPESPLVGQLKEVMGLDADGEVMRDWEPNVEGLDGTFYGYLHHERNNVYQPMRIRVNATVSHEKPMMLRLPFVSADVALYFGPDRRPGEQALRLRMERRPFLNSASMMNTGGKNTFVFEGHGEGHGNVYLKIEAWRAKSVEGTLYTRQFGRVGPFKLIRNEWPDLDPAAQIMEPLGNRYETSSEPKWSLNLTVRPMIQPRDDVHNPFSPLSLGGIFVTPPFGQGHAINFGSYDFYTGRVAIETMDERILFGKVMGGRLHLKWLALNKVNLPRPEYGNQIFEVTR